MKITRIILLGVVVLFLLMMAVSSTVSAESKPSPTVIVTKGEGATFSDFSNGQEPPPHVFILNQDGSLFLVAGNQGHHSNGETSGTV